MNELVIHEHAVDCPDPEDHYGRHAVCPCPHCWDTGFLDANMTDMECDCPACLQKPEEAIAEIERLQALGHPTARSAIP